MGTIDVLKFVLYVLLGVKVGPILSFVCLLELFLPG